MRRLPVVLLAVLATVLALSTAATAFPPRAVLTHQGQVTRQGIASRAGSETDTVVEPDVAVDPLNANIAVAAAHDSRYADGGVAPQARPRNHQGCRRTVGPSVRPCGRFRA
jgi:hypothetical protein